MISHPYCYGRFDTCAGSGIGCVHAVLCKVASPECMGVNHPALCPNLTPDNPIPPISNKEYERRNAVLVWTDQEAGIPCHYCEISDLNCPEEILKRKDKDPIISGMRAMKDQDPEKYSCFCNLLLGAYVKIGGGTKLGYNCYRLNCWLFGIPYNPNTDLITLLDINTPKYPDSQPRPLDEVYEKFKHLDKCLSDTEWCGAVNTAAIYGISGELWRAIKEARTIRGSSISPDSIITELKEQHGITAIVVPCPCTQQETGHPNDDCLCCDGKGQLFFELNEVNFL